MDNNYILQMKNIRITFGALVANDNVNLNVKKGTVHALIGENGAGKSTLMNVLTGILRPDCGEIILNGEEVTFKNSLDAAKHGIGMVYQEFMLFNDLTVFDNIIMGFEEKKCGGLFIDRKSCRKRVEEICEKYHFNIPLDAKVADLPVAMLQQVEIMKVLYKKADIIVLDEPTSVLTPSGVEGLFDAIRNLTADGKTIIFISHKLKEVFAIADHITVLRSGKVTGNVLPSEVDEHSLANLMIGREVMLEADKHPTEPGETVLSVKNLRVKDADGVERVKGVDLDIHAGEIVGIAGVAGSGQQQLVSALFGLSTPEEGSVIEFCGKDITRATPREHRIMGIGYIPQDRLGAGGNGVGTLWENAIMGYHIAHGFKSRYFLDRPAIEKFTNDVIAMFHVKAQSIQDKLRSLSGGNMQKVVIAREFSFDAPVLLIAQPTRGVDVGAIEFIHARILEKRNEGCAILLCSADLDEVFRLSDRVITMYEGRITGEFSAAEISREEIGYCMTGGRREEAQA